MSIATTQRIDESKLTKEQLVELKLQIWENGGDAYFSKQNEGMVIRQLFDDVQKLKKELEGVKAWQ